MTRWLVAWVLFIAGDLVARTMRLHNQLGRLYPVYNRLMIWSVDVQGEGAGPWMKPVG